MDTFDDIPFDGPSDDEDRSDPTDPRGDPFAPPSIVTLVHCLHCDEEYESYLIEWRIEEGHEGKPHGFWCCPILGCDGKGFGFDILPVDAAWTDPDGRDMGWIYDDDEDDDEDEDEDGQDLDFGQDGPSDDDDTELPW